MTPHEISMLMDLDRLIDKKPTDITPSQIGTYQRLFAKYVAWVSSSPGNNIGRIATTQAENQARLDENAAVSVCHSAA